MSARPNKETKKTLPAKQLYKCSGCGTGYKTLPRLRDCEVCGAGADAIHKLDADKDAL